MIGMDFGGYVILLIISVVVSAILHYGFEYYVTPGSWSFASKIVVGWIGGWIGSPVFGHWWDGLRHHDIYIVPAILGALGLLILAVDIGKMWRGSSAT